MDNTIGWIGLGKMGLPMSQQLFKEGYSLKVFNRSKDKTEQFQGTAIEVVSSPGELLDKCDILILMVSDDNATEEIFNGPLGILKGSGTGKIIINMSTVSPSISIRLAAACNSKGLHYIDAPVSGSVKQAMDGQLVIMAGGDTAVVDRVKPVLEKMGKLILRVGDTGSGNIAKLAINALLAFQAQGLAESLLLAERNGIKDADLLALIGSSAIGNIFIKIKGDAVINNNYAPAFALKHIAKDLRLAKEIGLNTPLGNVAHNIFQQAEATSGDEDIIAILKYLRTLQHQ